jgi:hypothetical protein
MAQFIKAQKVDAVKKDRDGEAGYEITVPGGTRWQDAESFESAHTQVGDDDPAEEEFDDEDIVIDDE